MSGAQDSKGQAGSASSLDDGTCICGLSWKQPHSCAHVLAVAFDKATEANKRLSDDRERLRVKVARLEDQLVDSAGHEGELLAENERLRRVLTLIAHGCDNPAESDYPRLSQAEMVRFAFGALSLDAR